MQNDEVADDGMEDVVENDDAQDEGANGNVEEEHDKHGKKICKRPFR